ncbi:MAG: glycogen synthase [Flavobacteriaceae bacterium]|nr:glycogen synthase [Flavobacteriaceae bacterium]
MKNRKILYVSSEVVPYLPESEISSMSFEIPKMVNKQGGQIRIFMPRYGNINERRHQLHEVIRLSGLNLVINDLDMPLIIKVASIPKERIQVYFIDNEDYFKRKATFTDSNGKLFEDNDERAIFFAKGVFETIKRLNWPPDIIHIHGWMAALLPLYFQQIYKDDPIFQNSKIITSLYGNEFDTSLNKNMLDKILFDEIDNKLISTLGNPTYENLMKIAIDSSDAIIKGSENISSEINNYLKNYKNPILDFQPNDNFSEPYMEFYETLLA